MLTILCVLKSGGAYDAEWVAKLSRGLARHMTVPYRLRCLTDFAQVPCERIPLVHDWPGWWSKIELFRPGVIDGPTLYVDLDNLVLRCLAPLAQESDFAMLHNFHRSDHASSAVMWFKQSAPHHVYEKFAANPVGWIAHHEKARDGPYLGDQAFIWECFGRDVPFIKTTKKAVLSYKCNIKQLGYLPPGVLIVAFGGSHKPNNAPEHWVREAWA
jgi:hypothetical protein